jgi:hypothetical protein
MKKEIDKRNEEMVEKQLVVKQQLIMSERERAKLTT